MKRKYTIIWDNREKKPLLFPSTIVTLDDTRLPTRDAKVTIQIDNHKERLDDYHPTMKKGDYFLEEAPDACVLEKKYDLAEIATNCLNAHRRRNFIDEMDYLASRCRFPVLLMLGTHRELLRSIPDGPYGPGVPYPGVAVAALMRILMERNIRMETLSSETLAARQAAGKWAIHLLLSGAIIHAAAPERFREARVIPRRK